MGSIILYTGGSRSGKSAAAIERAKAMSERACFIATCEPKDPELRERVLRHQAERPAAWLTLDAPDDPAGALASLDANDYPVVIIDCMSLWIFNLMTTRGAPVKTEDAAADEAEALCKVAREFGGLVLLVTNEVGMGIIPGDPLSRSYVDCLGRCNQVLARHADKVRLYVSGVPLQVKG